MSVETLIDILSAPAGRPVEHAMEKPRRGIQSIEIGTQLLVALGRHVAPMALRDLGKAAGVSVGKAHPYLVSFLKVGFVVQDSAGRYELGPLALQLGLAKLQRLDPIKEASPLDRTARGRYRRQHCGRRVGELRTDHRASRGADAAAARQPAHGYRDVARLHRDGKAVCRLHGAQGDREDDERRHLAPGGKRTAQDERSADREAAQRDADARPFADASASRFRGSTLSVRLCSTPPTTWCWASRRWVLKPRSTGNGTARSRRRSGRAHWRSPARWDTCPRRSRLDLQPLSHRSHRTLDLKRGVIAIAPCRCFESVFGGKIMAVTPGITAAAASRPTRTSGLPKASFE